MSDGEAVSDKKTHEDSTSESSVCARCGRSHYASPITLSDEVIKEFTRCMLGQRRFTRTLELFGGSMKVTFEALSAEQSEDLYKYNTNADWARMLDVKLLATLASVELVDADSYSNTESYSAEYSKRLAYCKNAPENISSVFPGVDSMTLNILRRSAAVFDVLCSELTEHVFNSDFYEGTGLF